MKCTGCKQDKNDDLFVIGRKVCKECRNKKRREYVHNNKKQIYTINKDYYWKNRESIFKRRREYYKEHPEKVTESNRRKYYYNKDDQRARQKVYEAIETGKLVRPDSCSKCRIRCKPHGHHKDYSKPLDILWLCYRCHLIEHGQVPMNSQSLEVECITS